jgi:hypothetical protein
MNPVSGSEHWAFVTSLEFLARAPQLCPQGAICCVRAIAEKSRVRALPSSVMSCVRQMLGDLPAQTMEF